MQQRLFYGSIYDISFHVAAYFDMKGDDSCTGIATEGENVDILCTMPTKECGNYSAASIRWVHAAKLRRKEITEIPEDEKYG